MVETNNIISSNHDNLLDEFSYFNNDFFTNNNFQSPHVLNESSLIDTINSIINSESNEQPRSNTYPFYPDTNDSPNHSDRENSVVSDIWDHQNLQDGHHHPSITTIDSNNDTHFETETKSQIENNDSNTKNTINHQNSDSYKIEEPKEKIANISDNNFKKMQNLINSQQFDVNFSNNLDDFDKHNFSLTSVDPIELSTIKNDKSNNFDKNKVEKLPTKIKEERNKEKLFQSLKLNQSFIDGFNNNDTDDFLSFHDNFDNNNFEAIFANTDGFDNYYFNSTWKTKAHTEPTQQKTPETSFSQNKSNENNLSENETDSDNEANGKQITETSDWLDINAQKIYEASSDEESTEIDDSTKILPKEMLPIDDLPKLEQTKHKCDGCFKVNRVSYGCSKQIIERLPNIDAFKEYNSPNKYTLKYAIQEGNPSFRYVNSEVKTRYDPSIKRYSTKVLYSAKGKKLKRDYPSLCPFCKVSESKNFDSLFYERNNSCYRGHLINTHGINSTGERAKLPRSGFVCYKLGKNVWSETVGFKCPYENCNQCFLKGDKTHGFHEYIRHWNRFHISVD